MNFWLTVLTGISDPELVFDSHSFQPVMIELVPTYENSMDSIPADKVLKKTRLDMQIRFPISHACPKCLAAYRCDSAFPQNGLASRHDRTNIKKRWLTGNVG